MFEVRELFDLGTFGPGYLNEVPRHSSTWPIPATLHPSSSLRSTVADMADSASTDNTARDSEVLDHRELQQLARIATDLQARRISTQPCDHGELDPRLDPTSPDFDHYRWAETMLESMTEAGIAPQTQTACFANLSVSGSGSSLQIQQTVLSGIMTPFQKKPSTWSVDADQSLDDGFSTASMEYYRTENCCWSSAGPEAAARRF